MIHMGHGHGVYIRRLSTWPKIPEPILRNPGMPMHTKIKEGYEGVGHDRIMFGTDAPFHHPSVNSAKPVSGLAKPNWRTFLQQYSQVAWDGEEGPAERGRSVLTAVNGRDMSNIALRMEETR